MLRFLGYGAVALLAGADAPVLVVSGDAPVAATVHGAPARLRIDPGAPSIPVINPDFAARTGFKSGWIGSEAKVGPVRVHGKSAVVRFNMGDGEFKRRVIWFGAAMVENADGIIGPASLQADRIRFDLRAPQPRERSATLPLADFGFSGMGVEVIAGGKKIQVMFHLTRERTLATAAAGAAIAGDHDGKFDAAPERMIVNLAVERPVRRVALGSPLQVGPLSIGTLFVRTGDFGSASAIPDANAPEGDPDEIVVTAEKKQKQRMRLEIGGDDLSRCSSILFDKKAKTVTLSCR